MALPVGPQIRGSVIKPVRAWVKATYGESVYQAGLAALEEDERVLIMGSILPSSTYPLLSWDKFLAGVRIAVKAKTGESEAVFDMRNMRESAAGVLQSLFGFVLGLMSPVSAVPKVSAVFNRVYSVGKCQVVENGPGRAVLRFVDADPLMKENLSHHFPAGIALILELNGAKDIHSVVSKMGEVTGRLFVEATVTYKA